jgi:predicted dehydrogenase
MPDVRILGVVDTDWHRAKAAAESVDTRAFDSIDQLLDTFEATQSPGAAVVTTPTATHLPVASTLIRHGVHVLVEKPVASTVAEAEELRQVADKHAVVSMVGHIERFNPVVLEMLRPEYGPIRHIDIQRIGPFTARILDNVVDDLMIHDLDIVRQVALSPLTDIKAIARVERSSTYDMAIALLTFESGITASLTASRLGQKKVRSMEFTLADAVVCGDLLRQTVTIHRSESSTSSTGANHRHTQTYAEEVPFLAGRVEPLRGELDMFLEAARRNTDSPLPLAEGIEAMRMAAAIRVAITD